MNYIKLFPKNKYCNKKCVDFNGIAYDSIKEKNRGFELELLQKANEISQLQRQVKYVLLPSQYKIIKGKKVCLEKECAYYCDFQYIDKNNHLIVEDVKSKATMTAVYKIKKKLMLYMHGIIIKEIL